MNYNTVKLFNLEEIDINLSKSFVSKENIIINLLLFLINIS